MGRHKGIEKYDPNKWHKKMQKVHLEEVQKKIKEEGVFVNNKDTNFDFRLVQKWLINKGHKIENFTKQLLIYKIHHNNDKYTYAFKIPGDTHKYILARVLYEAANNMTVSKKFVIHHINQNPADNMIDNLRMMTHKEHVTLHKNLDSSLKSCVNF